MDANINKELVHSMIECLRPGGDSAGLVYCIQALVERRFKRMQESGGDEFIKAAIHLFQVPTTSSRSSVWVCSLLVAAIPPVMRCNMPCFLHSVWFLLHIITHLLAGSDIRHLFSLFSSILLVRGRSLDVSFCPFFVFFGLYSVGGVLLLDFGAATPTLKGAIFPTTADEGSMAMIEDAICEFDSSSG